MPSTSWDHDEIGLAYLKSGELQKAESSISKGIAILKKYYPDEKSNYLRQLINLNSVYKAQGKYAKVNDFYESVIKELVLNPDNEDLHQLVFITQLQGETYHSWGKYEKAIEAFHNAMRFMTNKMSDNIFDNPIIKDNIFLAEELLRDIIRQKGESSLLLYNESNNEKHLLSAIDAFTKLDSLINKSLLNNWKEGSHQVELNKSKSGYQHGIEASLTLYKKTGEQKHLALAFQFASKFKSRLLARGINLKEKENEQLTEDQKSKVDSLRNLISSNRNELQIALLTMDTLKQGENYEALFSLGEELKIFQKDNNISNLLTYKDIDNSLSIDEIQSNLNASEAILEYHLGDSSLYIFIITKDEFNYETTDFHTSDVIDYYERLTKGEKLDDSILSRSFFGVLDSIKQNSIEKLVIIPDGDLLQLPFEAIAYDRVRLLDRFDVSYEYSTAFLFDTKSISTERDLVGFASDYTADNFDVLHENISYGKEGIYLSELKNTIAEIKLANQSLEGLLFENKEATKFNFEKYCNNNKVLHLALHGVINNEEPDQTALVFSSENEDHLLTASEIYNMEINNKLTILSACNTGVGPVRVGDGVRSMARSFIQGGSESVITSLWEISDVTTKEILNSFYIYLNKGKTKSAALRQAKLDYIAKASPTQRHPKYWAHLVLIGDSGSMGSTDSSMMRYGLIALSCLVLLMLLRNVLAKGKKT